MNSTSAKREGSGTAPGGAHEEIRYGEGKVLEYESIGTIGKLNLVAVRLEVLPPQGEPYEIAEQWVVPGDAQSYLQVGLRMPIGITADSVDFVDPLFGNVSRAIARPTVRSSLCCSLGRQKVWP